jgi:hypothetical protein
MLPRNRSTKRLPNLMYSTVVVVVGVAVDVVVVVVVVVAAVVMIEFVDLHLFEICLE